MGVSYYQDEAPFRVFPVFFSSEHSQPHICEKTPSAREALLRMHRSIWISEWTLLVLDFLLRLAFLSEPLDLNVGLQT